MIFKHHEFQNTYLPKERKKEKSNLSEKINSKRIKQKQTHNLHFFQTLFPSVNPCQTQYSSELRIPEHVSLMQNDGSLIFLSVKVVGMHNKRKTLAYEESFLRESPPISGILLEPRENKRHPVETPLDR